MYSGVPIAIPGVVRRTFSSCNDLAMPEVNTLTKFDVPSWLMRNTFSGLRSR